MQLRTADAQQREAYMKTYCLHEPDAVVTPLGSMVNDVYVFLRQRSPLLVGSDEFDDWLTGLIVHDECRRIKDSLSHIQTNRMQRLMLKCILHEA